MTRYSNFNDIGCFWWLWGEVMKWDVVFHNFIFPHSWYSRDPTLKQLTYIINPLKITTVGYNKNCGKRTDFLCLGKWLMNFTLLLSNFLIRFLRSFASIIFNFCFFYIQLVLNSLHQIYISLSSNWTLCVLWRVEHTYPYRTFQINGIFLFYVYIYYFCYSAFIWSN